MKKTASRKVLKKEFTYLMNQALVSCNIHTYVHSQCTIYIQKRGYYRLTVPFTRKPLLNEITYPYYDWFRSLD